MPRITDPTITSILQNPYFDQHTAMHLARERLRGTDRTLILPPCLCDKCRNDDKPAPKSAAPKQANMPGMTGMQASQGSGHEPGGSKGVMADAGGPMKMIAVGQPGSGKQLLDMHHEMIRAFRYLLEHNEPKLYFLADWYQGNWRRPDGNGYMVQLWGLDSPEGLPHEITGMLSLTDPHYLDLVYKGVEKRIVKVADRDLDSAIDELGRFIELGVPEREEPDGSGFHDTMHEYLAAREGRAARGAEMNKLAKSRYNDYFWGLHLWMEGQYARLMEKNGKELDMSPLDPATLDMCTSDMAAANGKMPAMTMSMGKDAT